ncbi:MAG: sigma-54-dependent Fis family transcriptional regulator [Hydrocarboniphaga sp.]|uniref:sigma-54-dependent transcriptional regulator n=1 Tax=Hydrocarboniphaga sp. TaxID=2033016 RepID=UPI00260C58E6|nr:sigma-54 dependent transcriptional regulator [Hydrocarboniphaga sp.]MDB5970864.1 sigma-54-dependent Fis family transcriptional regulator [Hydrocarboniphaga sp.]
MSVELGGANILLVDDDGGILRLFRRCLEGDGHRVSTARSAAEAEAALGRNVFDACVLDLDLGEDSGLDLLPKLREWAPWMRVIMATATDDVATALSAIRVGAADYLVKPCDPSQLSHAVAQQVEARRLEQRVLALENDRGRDRQLDLRTANPALSATLDLGRRVAGTDATLLLLGESGTGKSVLARAIHDMSPRREAAFATVSCPSLSAELLTSELFGHVRGAFTGATDSRQGRVQIAEGGTLFLDEIGDLPIPMQPKLLRFLQDREYERVGDPHTRTANVRVIAATNQDLKKMVAEGRFREDLYYRLNVVTLLLPTLRDRREDVLPIAGKILLQLAARYDRPARRFSKDAASLLSLHTWPGNLRELHNAVERAVIICEGEAIGPEHLPFGRITPNLGQGLRAGDPVSLEDLERAHIEAVVASTASLEAAAKLLKIDSSTLYRKRKAFDQSVE